MAFLMKHNTELFKQYMDNPGFKRWMADTVFGGTYEQADVTQVSKLYMRLV